VGSENEPEHVRFFVSLAQWPSRKKKSKRLDSFIRFFVGPVIHGLIPLPIRWHLFPASLLACASDTLSTSTLDHPLFDQDFIVIRDLNGDFDQIQFFANRK